MLDRLSDEALRASHFQWFKPSGIPEEGADDEEDVEDEAELNLDKVEEEMAAEYSDEEDEDDILHINGEKKTFLELRKIRNICNVLADLNAGPAVAAAAAAATSAQRPEEIMESTTDAEEWRMEVEKVAPQLKVTVRVDNRDWRTHLEQMHSYRTGIEEALTTTKVQLDKLHSDIARTLEKIASREKYLNSQLEGSKEYSYIKDSLE